MLIADPPIGELRNLLTHAQDGSARHHVHAQLPIRCQKTAQSSESGVRAASTKSRNFGPKFRRFTVLTPAAPSPGNPSGKNQTALNRWGKPHQCVMITLPSRPLAPMHNSRSKGRDAKSRTTQSKCHRPPPDGQSSPGTFSPVSNVFRRPSPVAIANCCPVELKLHSTPSREAVGRICLFRRERSRMVQRRFSDRAGPSTIGLFWWRRCCRLSAFICSG